MRADDAGRLAARIERLLLKQVKGRGYEVDAILSKKEGGEGLGIIDCGDGTKVLFSVSVKIIITSHDVVQFPMELGDNPEDILDFVWLPAAREHDGEDVIEIDEGMNILYLGGDYTVTHSSPVRLGGRLVAKECRAKRVR